MGSFLILSGLVLAFSLFGVGLIGHFLRHSKKPPRQTDISPR
jgi:hypothetical protein